MHLLFLLLVAFVGFSSASNCSRTSVGFVPLIDMTGQYEGQDGKLYPGSNNIPPAHLSAAMDIANAIGPLDSAGNPSASGEIVWFSIGMSNTNGKSNNLIPKTNADPAKAPEVHFVNGAQGGVPVEDMIDPLAPYWTSTVPSKLSNGGVTAEQVQIIWLLQTHRSPSGPFFSWASDLKDDLGHVCRNAYTYFPNLKIIYITSRSYAGYASSTLNPEPYAYQSGFSVKWLIEDQINGDSTLNYNPANGPVKTGILLWGSYIWADGTTPNSEGLSYDCSDYSSDGTHPSSQGYDKIGSKLLEFYQNDQTCVWYRGTGGTSPPPTSDPGSGGDHCYGMGRSACLTDCECAGCQGAGATAPVKGCVPAWREGECGGTWYPGVSPCSPPPTTVPPPPPPTTSTTVPQPPPPTTSTTVPPPPPTTNPPPFDCSVYNGNPAGCQGDCRCGYCPTISGGCGCLTGDASGPDPSHGCTCSGSWQFFGPCP
jgi:hypothetical protein